MKDLRLWLGQNYGALLALALFVLMFAIYIGNHSAGLTVPVVTTAANKGVLLALVAMAQTLPILTGGLDLSVGMVFIMCNSLASTVVLGSPLETALGVIVVLGVGALAGFINGCIVVYGRLQPIITTLATGAVYYGIALWLRPIPAATSRRIWPIS